jgi:hypothetical protein
MAFFAAGRAVLAAALGAAFFAAAGRAGAVFFTAVVMIDLPWVLFHFHSTDYRLRTSDSG